MNSDRTLSVYRGLGGFRLPANPWCCGQPDIDLERKIDTDVGTGRTARPPGPSDNTAWSLATTVAGLSDGTFIIVAGGGGRSDGMCITVAGGGGRSISITVGAAVAGLPAGMSITVGAAVAGRPVCITVAGVRSMYSSSTMVVVTG